jgi:hypothetical protein
MTFGNGSAEMTTEAQIEAYIGGQPAPKSDDMRRLHRLILGISPGCRTWFLDGRDDTGKIVTNPNIGYGSRTISYANGTSREFYRVGISANTAGISIYIIGIEDKEYLKNSYGDRIGKASITGYCVKFRSLKDVDIGVIEDMCRSALDARDEAG